MKRLAIVGAGDLGLQLANLARISGGYTLAGFFDDTRSPGDVVADSEVLGHLVDIEPAFALGQYDCLVVAVGYKHLALRQKIHDRHVDSIPFATLVHPSAIIDPSCHIEEGTVIYPGCVLDMGVSIGANSLLNVGCVVAHHSEIGSGCFLSPAVSIAGFVRVESGCVLGIGTVVIDNLRIASGSRTGAGAVVTRHLEVPGLYLGVPARLAKEAMPS
ncbi:sugar O-acyltransferase (sialic acid O-acetyltransferase NeuD family) [Luteimonas cucumeris]|uniref:Sugar O-acyltransferase (Sialic acid O-acetyltransferase NeuD family) n=1 Tax=Luteimonas cucumeris TaxID=985012 RepID=A0A562L5N1_9GAMM|nr:NeuD/PglB/VioB family sugar acetyltransferase [Luteimonas cucumeris]TWI02969.1 sugar O-acyltransferase (sialic acid O-acetyltransferase NeuD family) [Luteimonas cucumeris]